MDYPEVLPYYIKAVKRGWADIRQRGPRNKPEGEEVPEEVSARQFDLPEEHGGSGEHSGEDSGSDSGGVLHVEQ